MWYQAVLIPYLIYPTCCHVPKNNSDVIVTYEGHAEAEPIPEMKPVTEIPETTTIKQRYIERLDIEEHTETSTPFFEETEGVMFIPNEKPVFRNDDEYLENKVNIGDVLYGRSVDDVMKSKNIRLETDSSTNKDILFFTGKNNENQNIDKPKRREYHNDDNVQTRRSGNGIRVIKLDCNNLDCNNTLKSVCGGKMEHKRMRYRLFLNECFYRKVNCMFKYEENHFRIVPHEHCSQTAAHYSERPFVHKHHHQLPQIKPTNILNTRKSTASRRSLNLDLDGKFCSHPCPASCSDQYEPECAMSSKGQRRVFVNHCKLDYNSCSYGAVWHRRPLAECVGGQKADLTRNSAFIGWMQRVGIVDNKGRLSLS